MNQPLKDITGLIDIQLLVDTFYDKVRIDPLIGPIFTGIIMDKWPIHLEKMYRFWQTILLSEHTYFGTPFPPHAQLPIDQKHFDVWLGLWHKTIDEFFMGEKAEEAKWRGDKMAVMFLSKIDYYKGNSLTSLI